MAERDPLGVDAKDFVIDGAVRVVRESMRSAGPPTRRKSVGDTDRSASVGAYPRRTSRCLESATMATSPLPRRSHPIHQVEECLVQLVAVLVVAPTMAAEQAVEPQR